MGEVESYLFPCQYPIVKYMRIKGGDDVDCANNIIIYAVMLFNKLTCILNHFIPASQDLSALQYVIE